MAVFRWKDNSFSNVGIGSAEGGIGGRNWKNIATSQLRDAETEMGPHLREFNKENWKMVYPPFSKDFWSACSVFHIVACLSRGHVGSVTW